MSNILDKYCQKTTYLDNKVLIGNYEDLEAVYPNFVNENIKFFVAWILFYIILLLTHHATFFVTAVLVLLLVVVLLTYISWYSTSIYIDYNTHEVRGLMIKNKKTGETFFVDPYKIYCNVENGVRKIYVIKTRSAYERISNKKYEKYTKQVTKGKIALIFILLFLSLLLTTLGPSTTHLMQSDRGWYMPYLESGSIAYVSDDHMYFIKHYTIFQDLYTRHGPFVFKQYPIRFDSIPVVTINGHPHRVGINYHSYDVVTINVNEPITAYKIDGQTFTPDGWGVVIFNKTAFAIMMMLELGIIFGWYEYTVGSIEDKNTPSDKAYISAEVGLLYLFFVCAVIQVVYIMASAPLPSNV